MDQSSKEKAATAKAEARKLLFGKYETEEDAEKGFKELQSKLGTQGDELGTLRKQIEQYQAYLNQAKPVLDWYGQNYQKLAQVMQGGAQAQQPVSQQAQVQAAQALQANGSLNWLTPEEQSALVNKVASQIQSGALEPWQRNFSQQVEKYAQQQAQAVENSLLTHQKAFSDVLWRTLERVLPEDKVKEARDWHTEALKFADPRNIDPMAVANEVIGLRSKASQFEKEANDYKTKLTEREQQDAGLLNGSKPFSLSATVPSKDERATSREDRFAHVMNATKAEHGQDGVAALFGNRG